MKRTRTSKRAAAVLGDLRPEYKFDYRKGTPNRFAGQPEEGRVVVVLDSDVSKVFRTPDAVNGVLRALIETMPTATKRRRG